MGRVGLAAIGVLLGVLVFQAGPVQAVPVRFPLTIEHELLRTALRKHLRDQAGEDLVLWRSADGCRQVVMQDAQVDGPQGRLRLAGPATAQAGLGVMGYCWAQVTWSGRVEVYLQPEVSADWQVHLKVVDTLLLEPDRQRPSVAARVWDAVRDWATSALPTFSFDLSGPVRDVRTVLGSFGGSPRLRESLDTLRPTGVLAVEPDALKVEVAMEVPAAPVARGPEPALSPERIKRWQTALESWDGFVTFTVKDLGIADSNPQARTELLDLLLSARQDIVAVLGRGPSGGPDPVQALFVSAWSQLRSLIRRVAAHSPDQAKGARYLGFLAAGDALAALVAVAPAVGLEFSADGLRRLARMLDPIYAGDPLEYSELPDGTVRQLFRFRDPDAPPRRRRAAPQSWLLPWLGPRVAQADDLEDWVRLGRRLDRWVPEPSERDAYRETVSDLLTLAAERTFDPVEVPERFEALFRNLVKATAWQESCWRQFWRRDGIVTYILSRTSDVGMMQINIRVWRGFFHPERLRWSATYNAGAGAEILYHLLDRYGAKEGASRLENAARATYSAYNGGPRRVRRWRTSDTPEHLQAVDRAFWAKYQLVASNRARDRVLCQPPQAAGPDPRGAVG